MQNFFKHRFDNTFLMTLQRWPAKPKTDGLSRNLSYSCFVSNIILLYTILLDCGYSLIKSQFYLVRYSRRLEDSNKYSFNNHFNDLSFLILFILNQNIDFDNAINYYSAKLYVSTVKCIEQI